MLANFLGLIVTVSLAGFSNNAIVYGIAAFCSVALFILIMFSVGHKDGEHERKLITRKVIETPEPKKWYVIGVIVWVILCIPCIVLVMMPAASYLIFFRFACGSMFALSLLFGMREIPFWAPFIFMGIFALTPIAARYGFYIGFYDKITIDSIVYEKKKN